MFRLQLGIKLYFCRETNRFIYSYIINHAMQGKYLNILNTVKNIINTLSYPSCGRQAKRTSLHLQPKWFHCRMQLKRIATQDGNISNVCTQFHLANRSSCGWVGLISVVVPIWVLLGFPIFHFCGLVR